MTRFRIWMIKLIVGKKPIAMNLHLVKGLYIDADKTKDGYFNNVIVDYKPEVPDDYVGYYFWRKEQ